jgi:hypothetical protein
MPYSFSCKCGPSSRNAATFHLRFGLFAAFVSISGTASAAQHCENRLVQAVPSTAMIWQEQCWDVPNAAAAGNSDEPQTYEAWAAQFGPRFKAVLDEARSNMPSAAGRDLRDDNVLAEYHDELSEWMRGVARRFRVQLTPSGEFFLPADVTLDDWEDPSAAGIDLRDPNVAAEHTEYVLVGQLSAIFRTRYGRR